MKTLTLLRNLMKDNNIDTYIITKFDPHQSEYAHPRYNGVHFISGFGGSNGTVVITQDTAGLWTDARYFLQADKELQQGFILHKEGVPGTVDFLRYARDITPQGGTIGFCGESLTPFQAKQLRNNNLSLKFDQNLINKVWENRPTFEREQLFTYDTKYTGATVQDKLTTVRTEMAKYKAELYPISSLDDIAWLLNIRSMGNTSSFNFLAYLVLTPKTVTLFIDTIPADSDAIATLQSQGVTIKPYNQIYTYLETTTATTAVYSPKRNSFLLASKLANKKTTEIPNDITTNLKACKNETEIQNTKIANEKEGANFVRLIKWLKETVGTQPLTEHDVVNKISEIRSQTDGYLSHSFEPIVGYGPNGAIVHYRVEKETALDIHAKGSVLIDTGAHYIDGTTDITRTIVLGELPQYFKRHYTACLQGNIALGELVFVQGTIGLQIDAIAKAPLWQIGATYGHGTGHGVGHLLNVHEGPANISTKIINEPIKENMLFSNEPGIYIENEYGIRLETSLFVKKAHANQHGVFFCFDNVVLVPFDNDAIDKTMLSQKEIDWLNAYHQTVYTTLEKYLTLDEQRWLKTATAPL